MKERPYPLIIIQNEWCVVFCSLCDSSFPRKYIFFGKRYCINPNCENHINKSGGFKWEKEKLIQM